MAPGRRQPRLIVALDLADLRRAEALAEQLSGHRPVFKIGHQLAYTGGLGLAERLIRAGQDVFLDLKLHDIPRTVEEGVRSLAGFGASLLTVHAYPQTMRAAVAGRGGSGLKLLAVTVLTSMDDTDAAAAGYRAGVAQTVAERAADAAQSGIDGLVCAAGEIAGARRAIGPDRLLVVPGIRPAGEAAGDQKRVMTPREAVALGADYLVVGRPIVGAPDPVAAAAAILSEMEEATRR
ncbi:orotidine-5'-phosphate decarboxylase [Enterovirga sp.]|uniref:orotidine-5'-phosphate decarboxylase n=1 Tax=Enterovirga sp. TaxID=2026350 RepID=UPI00262155A8|nr:orotidine-5'-phosphate decarboxylase [Enterovirga sp.]MDB5589714.1 orotidine 5-phosphate decarboxylase [Enterovirga sp.]